MQGSKPRSSLMLSLSFQSDIYFTATTAVNEVSSGGSSKGASAHNSPQTPPGRDTPVFPSSLGEGEVQFYCLINRYFQSILISVF